MRTLAILTLVAALLVVSVWQPWSDDDGGAPAPENRSFFTNGLCGEGTNVACPGSTPETVPFDVGEPGP